MGRVYRFKIDETLSSCATLQNKYELAEQSSDAALRPHPPMAVELKIRRTLVLHYTGLYGKLRAKKRVLRM